MFLCTELMFQGVAINLIAFGRYRLISNANLFMASQAFVIFVLVIAAAEAALALGPGGAAVPQKQTLDAEAWQELKGIVPTPHSPWNSSFAIQYSYLIPLLPLIGAAIAGFLCTGPRKTLAHWPIWLGVGASAAICSRRCSSAMLQPGAHAGGEPDVRTALLHVDLTGPRQLPALDRRASTWACRTSLTR